MSNLISGFDEEGFNKNIDLLRQIAERSQAAVGKWDTPLPGQRRTGGVRTDRHGTKLTAEVLRRRAEKRKRLRSRGYKKVNGFWVRDERDYEPDRSATDSTDSGDTR